MCLYISLYMLIIQYFITFYSNLYKTYSFPYTYSVTVGIPIITWYSKISPKMYNIDQSNRPYSKEGETSIHLFTNLLHTLKKITVFL